MSYSANYFYPQQPSMYTPYTPTWQQQQWQQQQMPLPQPGGTQYYQQVPPPQAGGTTRRNEIAERVRIARSHQQEREKRAKRKAELGKDPGALYHSYTEYLEYFPLVRCERPNPYLVGLLANQAMPVESDSDLGLAIQYAKRHWENTWQMRDLGHLVGKAKEEIEKKTEEFGQVGVTCSMDLRW
ncbi:hypothetical protein N0V86_006540 [Didymella sp. IMI 355093]|nr:hypothetical protein N0V86_006540 [Didymella sp. IMI 355093]